MRARLHPEEAARLASLRSYEILDTPNEEAFDDLVGLAAQICGTPVSLVSLVDADRQWFKAKVGVDIDGTPLELSFCSHTILEHESLVVADASVDRRFADNPLVAGDPFVRFYAGVALRGDDGLPLGTLCVVDTVPRELSEFQLNALRVLAKQVMTQLELRRKVRQLAAREEERAAREKFVHLITDRLPVRVAYIDRDFRYRFINQEYAKAFGIAPEEAVGKSIVELAGPIAFEAGKDHLLSAFSGESHMKTFTTEYPFGTRTIEAHYVPDLDENGEARGAVVHVLDVTERAATQQALYESDQRLREAHDLLERIMEGTEELIVSIDPDFRFTSFNHAYRRAFEGVFGVSPAIGASVVELLAHLPEDQANAQGMWARALAGENVDLTSEFGDPLLGRRVFDLRFYPLLNEAGEVIGAGEIARDVTDRERLTAELKVEREKLQTLFELAPAFIAVLRGPRLVFEYVNRAFLQLVGHRSVVGHSVFDVLPETVGIGEVGQDYDQILLDVLETGKIRTFHERPAMIVAEEGAAPVERFLDLSYQPLHEPNGTVTGVLVHGIDVTDQVRARQEIAASEELFRTVVEQAPDDAIFVTDLDRKLLAWNPAAERVCGWPSAEVLGRSADFLFTPEDRARNEPDREADAAAQKGKVSDERWYMRRDGTRFWGSGTMNSLHRQDGTVRGFLKVFRDTTERYVETKALAFLRLLTDTVIDERDPEGIIGTGERMLGEYLGASRVVFAEASTDWQTIVIRQEWSPELPSIVGWHDLSAFGPAITEDFRNGRTHVWRNASKDYRWNGELTNPLALGAVAGIFVPIMKDDRLASLVIVHQMEPRDWTDDEIGLVRQVADRMTSEIERSRAEAALRQSEERFRQLVELSPSTVWFGEPEGGLSYISQDFYDATGITPDEALPSGWINCVHPEDRMAVMEAWSDARESGSFYHTEMRILHRDGQYRWFSARALPVRDREGRVRGWLGSNSDIQHQKETEETLRLRVEERTQELAAALKEAEGFNYSISHDLRAPLRAISSYSGILLEEAGPHLNEEHRQLLARQAHNANRLGRLIDELLRLSRLARVEVKRTPLDMTNKARTVAQDLEMEDRVRVQEGMTASGDPGLVRTVFENLIGNAAKFSPKDALIHVGQTDGVIWVRDEGIGFDMHYAPKIFLPFERLVPDSEFPGTGIGLANVERIVRRHGGKVWVESEPGKGATFFFTLG